MNNKKTYQQLSEELTRSPNIHGLINKKTKSILQLIENNSTRLSQSRSSAAKFGIIDYQIKLLSALLAKQLINENTNEPPLNEDTEENETHNSKDS